MTRNAILSSETRNIRRHDKHKNESPRAVISGAFVLASCRFCQYGARNSRNIIFVRESFYLVQVSDNLLNPQTLRSYSFRKIFCTKFNCRKTSIKNIISTFIFTFTNSIIIMAALISAQMPMKKRLPAGFSFIFLNPLSIRDTGKKKVAPPK